MWIVWSVDWRFGWSSPSSTRRRRSWLMIGACSIPTGQASTQALHCMQDQTVSACTPSSRTTSRVEQPFGRLLALDQRPEHAADAHLVHRRIGLLAQLEHHVAGRQRPAGRDRGAGLMALAALRAGVELEQVHRAEVGERPVAGGLEARSSRDPAQPLARQRVAQHERGEALQMWVAFVYGIAATKASASNPWDHHSACRTAHRRRRPRRSRRSPGRRPNPRARTRRSPAGPSRCGRPRARNRRAEDQQDADEGPVARRGTCAARAASRARDPVACSRACAAD